MHLMATRAAHSMLSTLRTTFGCAIASRCCVGSTHASDGSKDCKFNAFRPQERVWMHYMQADAACRVDHAADGRKAVNSSLSGIRNTSLRALHAGRCCV
jgi:hypothetical protein